MRITLPRRSGTGRPGDVGHEGERVSKITEELLRRIQRAATSPVQVTSDDSSLEMLYEATLAAEAEQFSALRDAVIALDTRLDAAGFPPAPEAGD